MTLTKMQHEAVDPNDPWARDKLERKKVADYLTPVLASIRQPFVISLHSPYGTGKSFFLECWKADLEQQGYKVVLFDAWKTDFSHDPLSAFIAALKKQTSTDGEEVQKRWLELAKRTKGFVRSKALPLLFRGLGRKLVGEDGVKEVIEDFSLEAEEVANVLSSAAVEALNAQEAAEQSMDDFRTYLAETAASLVEDIEDEDKKKLIIFVDELDRCKPSYAIEVLECIKHLFAVEGTVFVLAFDENQMLEAISRTYGLVNSGEGYLRKFVDWRFVLPEPAVWNYCNFLCQNIFPEGGGNILRDISEGIHCAALIKTMSLRQIEQAFTYANLVLRSDESGSLRGFGHAFGIFCGLFSWCQSYMKSISHDLKLAHEFTQEAMVLGNRDTSFPYSEIFSEDKFLRYFVHDEMVGNVEDYLHESGQDYIGLNSNEEYLAKLHDQRLFQRINAFLNHTNLYLRRSTAADYAHELLTGASKYMH